MKSRLITTLALLSCVPALAQTQSELATNRQLDKNAHSQSEMCDQVLSPLLNSDKYEDCKERAWGPALERANAVLDPIQANNGIGVKKKDYGNGNFVCAVRSGAQGTNRGYPCPRVRAKGPIQPEPG